MPPLRIAILECDTPLDGTRQKYGSYGGVFASLLLAGASRLSPPPEVDLKYYDVVNVEQYPELDSVDAILLSGSRHNSFDNQPWILKLVDFVKEIFDYGLPVKLIGVCFGHQIVGRALGAKVDRSEGGWEVSVTPMELSKLGKEIFEVEGDELNLHQMHRDAVFYYPKGVEQLAASPACPVQGMYVKNKLITVQGHPEFTEEIVTELLTARHESGVFTDEMYKDGMSRVGNKHDGVTVARAFLKFAMEG